MTSQVLGIGLGLVGHVLDSITDNRQYQISVAALL